MTRDPNGTDDLPELGEEFDKPLGILTQPAPLKHPSLEWDPSKGPATRTTEPRIAPHASSGRASVPPPLPAAIEAARYQEELEALRVFVSDLLAYDVERRVPLLGQLSIPVNETTRQVRDLVRSLVARDHAWVKLIGSWLIAREEDLCELKQGRIPPALLPGVRRVVEVILRSRSF